MATFDYAPPSSAVTTSLLACESFSDGTHDGELHFVAASPSASSEFPPLVLSKRAASNLPLGGNDSLYYANMSKAHVLAAPTDVMGALILGRAADPTLEDVTTAIPPLRAIRSARVWVASRVSGVDATLDEAASNWLTNVPSPDVVRRHLPGISSHHFDVEGTLGDGLPTLLLGFPVVAPNASTAWLRSADLAMAEACEVAAVSERRYADAAAHKARVDSLREEQARAQQPSHHAASKPGAGDTRADRVRLWQMAAVPVDAGFEQRVMFRYLAVNSSGRVAALYYDTFAYSPSVCSADDTDAGCMPAGPFYRALLDAHFEWEATWRREGRMSLTLPSTPPTRGDHLARQVSELAPPSEPSPHSERSPHLGMHLQAALPYHTLASRGVPMRRRRAAWCWI